MSSKRSTTERSLLAAAAALLERGGPSALTTRAVLTEAGVTAPTLYHHFGDKDGLLDALLEDGIASFFAHKAALPETADAVADLLSSWDAYLDFVFDRPQLFRLLIARAIEEPRLLNAAMAWTRGRLEQLHGEGRLAVDVGFGVNALLAISNGVAMLRAQHPDDAQIREIARFIFPPAVEALIRKGQKRTVI